MTTFEGETGASTEDVMAHIRAGVGGVVSEAKPGYGSFLTITIDPPKGSPGPLMLWVYLADWALLEEDLEILAANLPEEEYAAKKGKVANLERSMFKFANLLSERELHLGFSGQYRLEIWANDAAYGIGADLVQVFVEGRFVGSLS
jgi:hypothetical protein